MGVVVDLSTNNLPLLTITHFFVLYSDRFYKKAIDGSLAAVNGELISIDDVYYDSYLGKEYRFYYAGGQILMVYRLFYVDGSLYQHGVITDPKKDKNESMNRFFKSFKLLKTNN